MNRDEFIEKLKMALNGSVDPQIVNDSVDYYNDYISIQMRTGKTEEQVLAELGDPRLLAKSIATASGAAQGGDYYKDEVNDYGNGLEEGKVFRLKNIPGWAWLAIGLIIFVLILGLIISLLSFLLPILLPVFVVLFFIKLFKDWLH